MYVLPYGQMSLWGATVITNMLSAVPWIGQDFVQFYPPHLYTAYWVFLAFASVCFVSLPTLGVVNTRALRGVQPRTLQDKLKYVNIPYSFLAMFIGLVDGDGYIKVTKTVKGHIALELVLSLDIGEESLLRYIHSVLGIGRVAVYPNTKVAKYIVGRVDLQEVLFPLLSYHNIFFLTDTRRAQYDLALHIMLNNIVRFADIPTVVALNHPLPTTATGYLSLPFFADWIVGFTIAEGSFYIKASGEFFFSLRQRPHLLLFQAFKLVFNTNNTIDTHGHYMKLGMSSVKDLTNVIQFFSYSGNHPLLGAKLDSYNIWISKMKQTPRFKDITLPV